MGEKAITVDKQVKKLKDRNMIMDWGDNKAREVLLDIGYYRLGFYWHPFETNNKHKLSVGTKFSDVVKLYYLDVDLKHILLKALNRIEINFKTKIIYFVSNYYDKNPIWFADKKIVSKSFVQGFHKVYNNNFINNNKPIKKHHRKHPNDIYAPAWKTLEFITFGSVIKLYLSLYNNDLKKVIANKYDIESLSVFHNYLNTILFIRNICAHSDLLYDSHTPLGIKSTPMIPITQKKRHSLSSSIKIICYFLEKISKKRSVEINEEIENLFHSFIDNKKIKHIISHKIGFEF